jgi:aspartokinase
MATVASTVERLLKESPLLAQALKEDIANISSVARKLKPGVEQILHDEVPLETIAMAVRRTLPRLKVPQSPDWLLRRLTNISVRSSLTEFIFENSGNAGTIAGGVATLAGRHPGSFTHYSRGLMESVIVVGTNMAPDVERLLKEEKIIGKMPKLAAITIVLPRETLITPGIYAPLFSALSWRSINLIEAVSIGTELSLIVQEDDVEQTYSVIKALVSEHAA